MKLITYPDSLGGDLQNLFMVLKEEFCDLFNGIHILPPFPSSGDRGFAPIDYHEIDPQFGSWADMIIIAKEFDVTLDLMVNHISSQSRIFQDYLENGDESEYKDFFLTPEKIFQKHDLSENDLSGIILRRSVPYSDYKLSSGDTKRIWTTFGSDMPSEQVDIDVKNPRVKQYFQELFRFFASKGIKELRMDAIGYVIKQAGTSCFFVEPEIYEFMDWIEEEGRISGISVLHEIHASKELLNRIASLGYKNYDFLLPYSIIQTLLLKDSSLLIELLSDSKRATNWATLIDCHDGIPVQPDMNGLINKDDMTKIIELSEKHGAKFSEVHSVEKAYEDAPNVHQICGTLYSLLGEDDDTMIAVRALQLFVPGDPQIYYEGLLAGRHDFDRYEMTNDPRELNRHNYTIEEIRQACKKPVVQRIMKLIRLRNMCDLDGLSFSCSFQLDTIAYEWINPQSNTCDCLSRYSLEVQMNEFGIKTYIHINGERIQV